MSEESSNANCAAPFTNHWILYTKSQAEEKVADQYKKPGISLDPSGWEFKGEKERVKYRREKREGRR